MFIKAPNISKFCFFAREAGNRNIKLNMESSIGKYNEYMVSDKTMCGSPKENKSLHSIGVLMAILWFMQNHSSMRGHSSYGPLGRCFSKEDENT